MRDLATITDTIRQSVSAYQVGEALGLNPDGSGRCACPIHAGHDKNMKLWKDESRFYCHVCHAAGDGIALVQAVNQCSFWQAVEWINSAFHLALPLDRPLDKNAQKAAENARKRKQEERERRKAIERTEFDLYVTVGKFLADLENDKEQYRPRTATEPWHPKFATACKLIPEVKELVEELAVEVIGVKNHDGR